MPGRMWNRVSIQTLPSSTAGTMLAMDRKAMAEPMKDTASRLFTSWRKSQMANGARSVAISGMSRRRLS